MNDETRATLLERLRDGDAPLAWEEFFDRYWRLIYSFSRRRGCSEQTAEEVVQDVMMVVFEQRDVFRYDPARGRFRDWLLTVVCNQVAQRRRRPSDRQRARGGNSSDAMAEVATDDVQPDDAWQAAFEISLLSALLEVVRHEVNPRTFQAFELFAIEELSGAEVARITGLSRNAVYQARKNVLRRLTELGEPYRDEGQLGERIKEALQHQPDAIVERSVTNRVAQTMRSR